VQVFRSQDNPLIKPEDVKPSRKDFEVVGVFNAAATRFGDEIVLLFRVAERPINDNPNIVYAPVFDVTEGRIILRQFKKDDRQNDFTDPRLIVRPNETYLTSISHLRLAKSTDGTNFEIEAKPALSAENEYESFGIEDPRITLIGDTYYITYVAVGPAGVTTCLASTKDFVSFERHGVIFCPENKDVVIFSGKTDGKYFALHRPVSPLFKKQDIWLAESPDLLCWGNHKRLLEPREDCWDNLKVGAGAPPVRTPNGWLEIYHAADKHNRYCLGAVLLDVEKPWKILVRTAEPILQPETDYECSGFFGNVVFTCGLLAEDDSLKIYYGAADTYICCAEIPLQDILWTTK
jgi:predicted GH43/DUF377 family glycosyl hydrolase